MSMFNDISWWSKDNEKCESNAQLVSLFARRFGAGQRSFLGLGSEEVVFYQWRWSTMMLGFAEIGHPIFRATSPLSIGVNSKAKVMENCRYIIVPTRKRFKLCRTITSVNQLSLYGAVAELCEEFETFHDRTGQPVMKGQSNSSFAPSVIKTEVPLDCDDLTKQDLLLQQYGERIEKVSQQDKLSEFSMDAWFLNVVEIGQYFMTKDTAEFSQFTDAVACREYTLPREEEASEPRGRIRGNTKIGPVLEVATCCFAR